MEAYRSILLPVPEVEPLVDPFRRAGDWSREHGVPAHMTIAGPWSPETELPLATLGALARELRGTRFELGAVGPLGSALCLFPTDDAPLLAWRERALAAVGAADRLDDDWRLHLTVSRGGPDLAWAEEAGRALSGALPITCEVRGLLIAAVDGAGNVTLRPL